MMAGFGACQEIRLEKSCQGMPSDPDLEPWGSESVTKPCFWKVQVPACKPWFCSSGKQEGQGSKRTRTTPCASETIFFGKTTHPGKMARQINKKLHNFDDFCQKMTKKPVKKKLNWPKIRSTKNKIGQKSSQRNKIGWKIFKGWIIKASVIWGSN